MCIIPTESDHLLVTLVHRNHTDEEYSRKLKAICPGLHCPVILKGGASKGQENSFVLSSLGQNQELSCPELSVTQAKRGSYSYKPA